MPSKKKHVKKRRSGKSGFGHSGSDLIRVPFRYVRYVTAGSATWTVAYVNLRPDQFGSKLTNIKDAYQLFRFTSLRIKSVFPLIGSFAVATPAGCTHAVAYSGEYLNNNPALYDAMSEFPRFAMASSNHVAEIYMNRKEIVGEDPLKWFRTDQDEPSGTAAEDFTTQGYVYWASWIDNGGSVGSFRHFVEIEGEVEFCQPKNTSLDFKGAVLHAPEANKFQSTDDDVKEDEPPPQSAFSLPGVTSVALEDYVAVSGRRVAPRTPLPVQAVAVRK